MMPSVGKYNGRVLGKCLGTGAGGEGRGGEEG